MPLLLDENLSPEVARVLREQDGLDVVHLRERGGLGRSDEDVLACAYAESRILVTSNVADFRKLAAVAELHPGIVLIENGQLPRQAQLEVIRRVCEALQGEDIVNRALTVSIDGTVSIEELPKP